jgi:hypothetical protein
MIDIPFAIAGIFLRDSVRAHESGDYVDRLRSIKLADGAQLLQLSLDIEAIPALSLAGRNPEAEHFGKERLPLLDKLGIASPARVLDSAEDTAAGFEYVQIRHPVELERQLLLPPAAENKMRVRVDKPRRNKPPPAIKHREPSPCVPCVRRANIRDFAVLDTNLSIRDKQNFPLLSTLACSTPNRRSQQTNIF